MTLVVEDGTGLSTANVYVSRADCTTYHADRLNTAWAAATDPAKDAALVAATAYLDGSYRQSFRGTRLLSTQALEWPRDGAVDDDDIYLTGIPTEIKTASFELALRALAGALVTDDDRGGHVRRIRVGEIEEEYEAGAQAGKAYRQVDIILGRLLEGGGGSVRTVRV